MINLLTDRINDFKENLLTENKCKFYAPFFRVFICLYLIKDFLVHWKYIDLLYKGTSFLYPERSPFLEFFFIDTNFIRENFDIFYFFYFIFILLFLFGIGKRFTAITLFIFVQIIQNLSWLTLNGGDNILKFLILYYALIDSFGSFSIGKSKKIQNPELNNAISNLGYYSIIIHIGIIYFSSAFHKINADLWFNGVATYYVLGGDRFMGTQWNIPLIKNGYFVTFSTYGTIILELLFPFLVWYKSLKYLLLVCMLFLHIGIAVFMMLYDFQIIFVLALGFFLTNNEWEALVSFFRQKRNFLTSRI